MYGISVPPTKVIDDDDRLSTDHQLPDSVRTDVPRSAGHQYAHTRPPVSQTF